LQVSTEAKVGAFVIIAFSIFVYTAIYLGVFRFDMVRYNTYYVNYKDLSGLDKKADIKMAGVKVGWIDEIALMDNGNFVNLKLKVRNKYALKSDSYTEVRQESLLGGKYLELYPGKNSDKELLAGGTLIQEGKKGSSIESIIEKFEGIAQNIEDVSVSLKSTLGTDQQHNLKAIIKNLDETTENFASFSNILSNNRDNLDNIINNLSTFSNDIAPVGKDIHKVAQKLDSEVLPAFQSSMERISDVFDRDFNRVAGQLDDTMQNIKSIAGKIDQGEGLLGKLVNESDVYDDIKTVARGFRESATLIDNMGVVVDSHVESMYRDAENYNHPDSKGYLNFRLHTGADWYYLLQLVGTERGGVINRSESYNTYFDSANEQLTDDQIKTYQAIPPVRVQETKIKRNLTKYGIQFGKMYNNLSLRAGLFEGTFGVGADYNIPFKDNEIRWVTSLEAYDFRGQMRYEDRRPHLKWLNKVFLFDSVYLTSGVDDFISRKNINAFFGIGLRFTDDNIKYMLDKLGLSGLSTMN